MKHLLKRLWQEEDGQDLTEYALLVVLIALAAIAAINSLSTALVAAFGRVTAGLAPPAGG
jgi:Flp pilus assembly pilin Flp